MTLTTIDWLIIAVYFALSLAIGLYYYRRAGENMGEFFVAGRNLPWWLAGTSMVATTFAADTPLAVTEMVARNGVAGNWLWWSMLPSGMLTVLFFARLWRRPVDAAHDDAGHLPWRELVGLVVSRRRTRGRRICRERMGARANARRGGPGSFSGLRSCPSSWAS